MKKSDVFIFIFSLILLSDISFSQDVERAFNRPFQKYNSDWYQLDSGDTFKVVSGEILIKVRQNPSNSSIDRFLSSIGGTILDTFNTNLLHVSFDQENDDIAVAKSLSGLDWVLDAKPNVRLKYAYSDSVDRGLGDQDWLDDGQNGIGGIQAWNIETGKPSVIVAIADGYFCYWHPDLAPNVWVNYGENSDNDSILIYTPDSTWTLDSTDYQDEYDSDGNNYVDDLIGWNVRDENYMVNADVDPGLNFHGTSVAGIIAARTHNRLGVAGLAGGYGPDYEDRGVRVALISCGVGPSEDDFLAAIAYADTINAHIFTTSLLVVQESPVWDAVEDLIDKGVLVTACAGNTADSASRRVEYHEYTGLIWVEASYDNSYLSTYKFGPGLGLLAPSGPSNNQSAFTIGANAQGPCYNYAGESSIATPMVAGAAALLLSHDSTLTVSELHEILCMTADAVASDCTYTIEEFGPYSERTGYGELNVYQALLYCGEKHYVPVVNGWSLISSPRTPFRTDVVIFEMYSKNLGEIEQMKYAYTNWNDTVITTTNEYFYPDSICELDPWDPMKAYKIKTTQADTLHIFGLDVLDPDTCLFVFPDTGCFWIPYLLDEEVSPATAVASLLDAPDTNYVDISLALLKDGDGNFWAPYFGFSNLGNMKPGKGYEFIILEDEPYVEEDPKPATPDTLIYNSGGEFAPQHPYKKDIPIAIDYIRPVHYSFQTHTGDFLPTIITGIEVDGVIPERGDEVGSFTGDDLCVGGLVWQGAEMHGLAIWHDDLSTPEKDGWEIGETIYFRFWDSSSETEYGLDSLYWGDNSDLSGDAGSAQRVENYSVTGLSFGYVLDNTLPIEFALHQNYPNPFNSSTLIKYSLAENALVTITIYDILGREVIRLVDDNQPVGHHTLTWTGSNGRNTPLPSGLYIYFIQAKVDGRIIFENSHKALLLR